jgi:hypothetical protein
LIDENNNENIIHIPIAEDCNTTFYLNKVNLRKEAYYFDWIIISPEVILNFFINNFENYFNLENMEELKQEGVFGFVGFKPTKIRVIDKVWKIKYLHHFNNIEKDYSILKNTFDKRIERLENHFKNNKKIIFYYEHTDIFNIILGETKSSFKYGKEIMKKVFPELKNYLLNKYSYTNPNEIDIKYIGIDIEDEDIIQEETNEKIITNI